MSQFYCLVAFEEATVIFKVTQEQTSEVRHLLLATLSGLSPWQPVFFLKKEVQ